MKKIIFVFLVLFLFSCKKEETSSAKISGNKGTKIDIEITSDIKTDSIIVTDNEFTHWQSFTDRNKITANFDKNVPHLYIIAFYINGKAYKTDKELWLDNGNPKLKLSFKNKQLVVNKVSGSPVYYEYFSFFKKLDEFDAKNDSVARNKYFLAKIDQHFNDDFSNLVASNYLGYNRSNLKNLTTLLHKIEKQSDELKNTPFSKHAELEKILNVKKFDLSAYSLIDVKGDTIKPAIKKDKLYLIDFWFVKCLPCVADHKLIQQRLTDFREHNIEVVGVANEKLYDDWNNYLAKHRYKWTNYKQIYQTNNSPTNNLGIDVYPTYIIVNSKGEIAPRRYISITEVFKDYLDK